MNLGFSTATCHLGSVSALFCPPRGSDLSALLAEAGVFVLLAEAGVLALLPGVGCLEVGSELEMLSLSSRKRTMSHSLGSVSLHTRSQDWAHGRQIISPREVPQFCDGRLLLVPLQPDVHVRLVLSRGSGGRLPDLQFGLLHNILEINTMLSTQFHL